MSQCALIGASCSSRTSGSSSNKEIVTFWFQAANNPGLQDDINGKINGTSIALTVPYGTKVTHLTPTITIKGKRVSPASGTPQSFANPVAYTVTAADGSTKAYTATVSVALNSAKDITRFTILGIDATINGTSIALTAPYGTGVTSLTPTITISGDSVSPPSGAPQNFTDPVVYTVTAADGGTKAYTATVNMALNNAKDITRFTILGIDANISNTSITLNLPYGKGLKNLTPTITIDGVRVSPASGTPQDFTDPVIYTVTAADGSTKAYTATMSVALPTVTITTIYTITAGMMVHSTTRGTVDLVHYHQGNWFVFHGENQGGNAFQTSADGIIWSGLKTGTNSDTSQMSRTYLIEGDQITKIYQVDIDSSPDVTNAKLYVAEGTIYDADIVWDSSHLIMPAGPAGNNSSWDYYNDLKRDALGRLHMTGRHNHDIFWMRAQNPHDLTTWETPFVVLDGSTSLTGDAHENIQLEGDQVYVLSRTATLNAYTPGNPGAFYGRFFDGTTWDPSPVQLGVSDGINGSDRRLSAVFDPNSKVIHAVYIDDSKTLYYRTLAKPYHSTDWSTPVIVATNTFTATMGIDSTTVPSRLALVYGNQRADDGGRWHVGDIRLKWFDGLAWEESYLLISEPGTLNWFPNMIRDVSGNIGVMYLKGWNGAATASSYDIMFSLIK